MKNNTLVFLGFLIICLVNLSAKSRETNAAGKAVSARPEMKMAETPLANNPPQPDSRHAAPVSPPSS